MLDSIPRDFQSRTEPQFRVTVVERSCGLVLFAPMGGGHMMRLSEACFHDAFEPFAGFGLYKRVQVQIDGGTIYPAWSNGRRWNGWACPMFDHEVMLQLVNEPDSGLVFNDVSATNTEAHVVCDFYDGMDIEVFKPETVETTEGPRLLWPIGAGFWIWDEVDS